MQETLSQDPTTASPVVRQLPLPTSFFDQTPLRLNLPPGSHLDDYLNSPDRMRLQVRDQEDRSEALIFEFAQRGVPQQVFRWTGWAGNIGRREAMLDTVIRGFGGIQGFHMNGGTEVRNSQNGSLIPTANDIPAALKEFYPENGKVVLIGLIPKVEEEPKYIEGIGYLVSRPNREGTFSIINPNQNIGILLQPDVNGVCKWIHEAEESRRQCGNLMNKGWCGNLIVFGGTPTAPGEKGLRNVEQELHWWAEDARRHPEWNSHIFLIRGSGGVADKYANDQQWLAANPRVIVLEPEVESIRQAIKQIPDIVTGWETKKEVNP